MVTLTFLCIVWYRRNWVESLIFLTHQSWVLIVILFLLFIEFLLLASFNRRWCEISLFMQIRKRTHLFSNLICDLDFDDLIILLESLPDFFESHIQGVIWKYIMPCVVSRQVWKPQAINRSFAIVLIVLCFDSDPCGNQASVVFDRRASVICNLILCLFITEAQHNASFYFHNF